MEKFSPSQPEKKNKDSSVTKKVMLGAALAGAVGSLSACKEGDVSEAQTGELEPIRAEAQLESTERQAQNFINEISEMEVGIEDARGRAAIRPVIETKFDSFTTNLYGQTTLETRAQAAELLLSEFPELNADSSFSLQVLGIVLSQYDLTPVEQEVVDEFRGQMSGEESAGEGRGRKQDSEVRTILDTDW